MNESMQNETTSESETKTKAGGLSSVVASVKNRVPLKVWILVGASLLLLLLVGGILLSVFNSPEYALSQMAEELSENGVEGLLPYMTEDVAKKVKPLVTVGNSSVVKTVLSFFTGSTTTGKVATSVIDLLAEKAEEIEWSLDDVLKNSRKAIVTIRFTCEGTIEGTLDLELSREDGEWKIADTYNLEVEKVLGIGG